METIDKLVVPGTLESTAAIRDFVKQAITLAGIDDTKRSYRLQLAVDEIATNIVTYGYQEHGLSGDIEVLMELTDRELKIILIDTAIPFDPNSKPPPSNLQDPLEMRGIGGYGIALAKKNVDRFEYEYVDGKNHNFFIINR